MSLFAGTPLQPVAITQADLDVLKSTWPLDRKYFAVAIERLRESGAGSITIDLAFPSPDVIHPESDHYWFSVLEEHTDVRILSAHTESGIDSNTIMGKYYLSDHRFFPPFSEVIQATTTGLILNQSSDIDNRSLISSQLLIEYPPISYRPVSFSDVLTGRFIPEKGTDIFIYSDIPGLSSYVLNPQTGETFSSGFLYAWTLSAIREGNFRQFWPSWMWAIVMLLFLSPLALVFGSVKLWVPEISAASLSGAGLLGLLGFGFHIPLLVLFTPVLPALLAGYRYFQTKNSNLPIPLTDQSREPVNQPNDILQSELDDLRYRVKFYEDISNQVAVESGSFRHSDGIWYHPDSPVHQLLKKASIVAKSDISVMISGESGTGKERIARFIHQHSDRSRKPFIAVNCAAFNENLIESELFGYEKGAFTGAFASKPGRFELANGGTLFLDEIGETPLPFQVKLLRVLQEGVFERVGGIEPIRVSVRIITATHQNMKALIKEKKFREDLFFRLNGLQLEIPALRDRKEDTGIIFRQYLSEKNPDMRISEALVTFLSSQVWPGNVRQLLASTDRALINASLKNRSFLIPDDFELESPVGGTGQPDETARQILHSLREDGFKHRSISAVAESLNIHRVTVTEYFRGWVIHFYLKTFSIEKMVSVFEGDSPSDNPEQLQNRLTDYLEGVKEKIQTGMEAGESNEKIRETRFKNLPAYFETDLMNLIQHLRTGK